MDVTREKDKLRLSDYNYEEVWELYRKDLIAYCVGSFKVDRYTAEDCVQEVYRSYWMTLRNGGTIKNPKQWLFKATKHECMRYKEKYKRLPTVSVDDHELPDEEDMIEKLIRHTYTDEKLLYMVADTLNIEQAFIYRTCFLEKRKSRDVAREMGIKAEQLYKKKCALKMILPSKIKETVELAAKNI